MTVGWHPPATIADAATGTVTDRQIRAGTTLLYSYVREGKTEQ